MSRARRQGAVLLVAGVLLVILLPGLVPALLVLPDANGVETPLTRPSKAADVPSAYVPLSTPAGDTVPAPLEGLDAPKVPDFSLDTPTDPLAALGQRIALGEANTVPGLSRLVGDYYAAGGYDVGPSLLSSEAVKGTKFNEFDENDTMSFTYKIGDTDGDGYDDLLINTYCVEFFCRLTRGGNAFPPATGSHAWCGTPHRMFALSGRNGTVLWEKELGLEFFTALDVNLPTDPNCPVSFVVGTIPDNVTGRDAILLYSIEFAFIAFQGYEIVSDRTPFAYIIDHTFTLLTPEKGEVMWTKTFQGRMVVECDKSIFFLCGLGNNRYVTAHDLLVNPILQVPPQMGARIVAPNTTTALFLQGVGFNFTLLHGQALPGETEDVPVTENYQPEEWAMSIQPLTGKVLWQKPTFMPDVLRERTVVPRLLQSPPLAPVASCFSGYWTYDGYSPWSNAGLGRDTCAGYTARINDPAYFVRQFGDVGVALTQFWHASPCCFDLTGDNVPDLSYTTIEWDAYPKKDGEAPQFLDSHWVVFDGATGAQVFQQQLAKDVPRFIDEDYMLFSAHAYHVQQELLGDANGDGVGDLLFHETFLAENYTQVVSLRDGKNGSELWRYAAPERMATLVIGDADKDGGNDVVFLRWHGWEYPRVTFYSLANVTATSITVRSGKTGAALWDAQTFNAPIDVYIQYDTFRRAGVPDVDGDGVGDVFIDDPLFLPDLTVVHRQKFLSGTDGRQLSAFDSVGAFATVSDVGDLTGDGLDDFALLSGDAPDLWVTFHNGTSGDALWSRRILAPRIAEYLLAFPHLAFTPMRTPNGTGVMITFHIEFQTTQVVFGSFFRAILSLYPQIAVLGNAGDVQFTYPKFWDETLYVIVQGPTPATAAFQLAVKEQTRPKGLEAAGSVYAGLTAATASASVAALGGGYLFGFWRFRK